MLRVSRSGNDASFGNQGICLPYSQLHLVLDHEVGSVVAAYAGDWSKREVTLDKGRKVALGNGFPFFSNSPSPTAPPVGLDSGAKRTA